MRALLCLFIFTTVISSVRIDIHVFFNQLFVNFNELAIILNLNLKLFLHLKII